MSVVARALNLDEGPHKVGGIYAINDKIKNDGYTFRIVKDTGPISYPMLKAVEWITSNCEGWRVTPDNLAGLDIELISAIRGMSKPFPYRVEAYIDGTGKLRREVVDAYELIQGLNVLEDTPNDIDKVIKIEQILSFAYIRWPSFAVLWDAVHRHKANYMGSIRPWVVEEIERLGLGIPVIGQKAPKGNRIPPGRPPVQILPTTWGIRFIQLTDSSGEQYRVTDQMRTLSRRIQSSLVPKIDRVPNVFKDRYLKL